MAFLRRLQTRRKCLRFQVMSDLHLEVGKEYSAFQIPVRAPYLILAGDVGRLQDYDEYLRFLQRQCNQFEMVFLVLGNHEFYGLSRSKGLDLASQLQNEETLGGKLKILHRRRIDISPDITVLGCTLHSHIQPENQDYISAKVRDFGRIQGWTVRDHNHEHAEDVAWLRNEIKAIRLNEERPGRKVIVVTHHAPIRQGSSRPEHEDSPQSDAFATELIESDADLSTAEWWIFGHTHYTTSCSRGGVKLVSNQRGYVILQQTEAPAGEEENKWQKLRVKLFRQTFVDPRGSKDQFDVEKCFDVMT